MPVTSVFSTTSKGGRRTASRSVVAGESSTWTTISRGSNGFSSVQSTAYGGPFVHRADSVAVDEELDRRECTSRRHAICATMRTRVTRPVRPSGDVMRRTLACDRVGGLPACPAPCCAWRARPSGWRRAGDSAAPNGAADHRCRPHASGRRAWRVAEEVRGAGCRQQVGRQLVRPLDIGGE